MQNYLSRRLMRPSLCLGMILISIAVQAASSPQPVKTSGSISDVVLYRGQAQVTRVLNLKGEGEIELVVENLPPSVDPQSLFAEAPDGVAVRAVRFRARAVGEEPREEVRRLNDEIDALDQKLRVVKGKIGLLSEKRALLKDVSGFVAPTAKAELSKGVLDDAVLAKLIRMQFEERDRLLEEAVLLEKQQRDFTEQKQLLERKRNEISRGWNQTAREAVIFIEKKGQGDAELKFNYLVRNAGWSPSYTAKSEGDTSVELEYNALVYQMTGEDWSKVKLTLSTATPNLSAQRMSLAPFRVQLASITAQKGGKQNYDAAYTNKQWDAYNRSRVQGQLEQSRSQDFQSNLRNSWSVNMAANDWNGLELNASDDVIRSIQREVGVEQPSLSYPIGEPISLQSRNDHQVVRIVKAKLPATFEHVATPVLSSAVYREAAVKNINNAALLQGPVSVFLNGRFVGRTELPTVAQGETFVLGLGADNQLRTRRELLSRTDDVQGGNRVLHMRYRLVVENHNGENVAVRVLERIPVAEENADIAITLDKDSPKLSENLVYANTLKSKGILRWDVTVPAQASGGDEFAIEYGYKLAFDKQLQVQQRRVDSRQGQEELEMLERSMMTF